jgi:hypothetical protein
MREKVASWVKRYFLENFGYYKVEQVLRDGCGVLGKKLVFPGFDGLFL